MLRKIVLESCLQIIGEVPIPVGVSAEPLQDAKLRCSLNCNLAEFERVNCRHAMWPTPVISLHLPPRSAHSLAGMNAVLKFWLGGILYSFEELCGIPPEASPLPRTPANPTCAHSAPTLSGSSFVLLHVGGGTTASLCF